MRSCRPNAPNCSAAVSTAPCSASARDTEQETGGGRNAKAEDAALRLIAVAHAPASFDPLNPAAAAAAAAPARSDAPARTEAIAERIATQVEQALKAELWTGAGRPVTLALPLDGMVDGLAGVTLTLSAGSLDIVLQRNGGVVSDDLIKAAQGLAERLQARFARRTVRVLDSVTADGGATAGAGGFGAIAHLLHREDGAA
jgi:hypothetical protein